jgi:hypothetical protein
MKAELNDRFLFAIADCWRCCSSAREHAIPGDNIRLESLACGNSIRQVKGGASIS